VVLSAQIIIQKTLYGKIVVEVSFVLYFEIMQNYKTQ